LLPGKFIGRAVSVDPSRRLAAPPTIYLHFGITTLASSGSFATA
jgi:hypothetical protein